MSAGYPHTGKMLGAAVKKQQVRKSALAPALERSFTTVNGYFKRASIQTSILWELSLALKHNFFADMAAALPPELPSNVPIAEDGAAPRIAELEAELTAVRRERDLLREILTKRG